MMDVQNFNRISTALAADNEIRVSNANEGGETILVHQPRRIKPSLGDVIREASKTK